MSSPARIRAQAWIVIVCLFAGCGTTGAVSTGNSQAGLPQFGRGSASDDLAVAERMIRAGEYHSALPRLENALTKYPDSPDSEEARFFLGLAHARIHSYHDATRNLSAYLERNPEGARAAEARALMAELGKTYNEQFPSDESLDKEIASVRSAANIAERDPQLRLADLLWRRGNYVESAAIYERLAQGDPGIAGMEIFQRRMERRADGSFVPLTPEELERRDIKLHPLAITNTSDFRSGRELITRTNQYYVVSGYAVNRGSIPLRGAEVRITIFGFGDTVFDTNTVTLGTIKPGETRPFSARFSNFEDLNAIDHYECVPVFQQ